MRQSIVLIGMMGAGKSAVGAELGRRLHVPVRDSDHEIEKAAAMTITEIFARDGEEFFRARETEVLARLLRMGPAILSTGGGAWMRPENRALIRASGVSVWLDCTLETLWHRVRLKPTRPLLRTPDPRGTLEQLLAERAPVYAEADLRVQVDGRDSVGQTTDRVLEAIRRHRSEVLEES
ncbi:MAG TPA: shikimate kinase [Paracoccus sp. (in: a-proteobacteria)]|nr:shikimate kinase [Paracoccus sp. (in: a-proteobacteria)]